MGVKLGLSQRGKNTDWRCFCLRKASPWCFVARKWGKGCRITVQTQHCVCVSLYSWRLRVWEGDMWGWEGRGNRALEKTAYRGASSDIILVIKLGEMRFVGACGTFLGRIETYALFWWGNLRGKRPLGRPRCRWERNIKTEGSYSKRREDMAWINQAQDRDKRRAVVNTLYGTAELLSACVEEICSVEWVSCDRPFRFFSDSAFYAAFNRPGNSPCIYIYIYACTLRWQRRVWTMWRPTGLAEKDVGSSRRKGKWREK